MKTNNNAVICDCQKVFYPQYPYDKINCGNCGRQFYIGWKYDLENKIRYISIVLRHQNIDTEIAK